MDFRKLTVLSYLFFLSSILFAQKSKDRSGFTYGGGFGAYYASGSNALFYNGANNTQNAVINVTENFSVPIGSNSSSNKEQLYNVLKDDIIGYQFPSKMSYNPAVALQAYLAYIMEDNNSVFGQIKYSKLTTNGVFSIELASPDTSRLNNSTNRIVKGGLRGSENRVDFEFGYHILLDKTNKVKPFLELLGNINSVTVKSHQMNIKTSNGEFTASFIHYTINTMYTNQTQGGMGYGFGSTIGIEGQLNDKMYFHLGLQGTMKTIHLLDNPTLTPHVDIMARILF